MKKLLSSTLVLSSAVLLAACSGTTDCVTDELDGCGRGSAYTEERTILSGARKPAPAPAPVAEPAYTAPAPAPTPAPAPAPVPEPVTGTADRVFDSRLQK